MGSRYWEITPHNAPLYCFRWKIGMDRQPNTDTHLLGVVSRRLARETVFVWVERVVSMG